jgi:hypothetical protein
VWLSGAKEEGAKKQWVPDALSFSRHVESYISHQKTDFAYQKMAAR